MVRLSNFYTLQMDQLYNSLVYCDTKVCGQAETGRRHGKKLTFDFCESKGSSLNIISSHTEVSGADDLRAKNNFKSNRTKAPS